MTTITLPISPQLQIVMPHLVEDGDRKNPGERENTPPFQDFILHHIKRTNIELSIGDFIPCAALINDGLQKVGVELLEVIGRRNLNSQIFETINQS